MPFVVTESCIKCRYTDCVDVCPMSCFHAGPEFLVIDPQECIDCSICVPECPVRAIVAHHDVPEDQRHFIALNARLARDPAWPVLARSCGPLAGHAEWAGVPGKRALLPEYGQSLEGEPLRPEPVAS